MDIKRIHPVAKSNGEKPIKKVINGKSFNTATSEMIHEECFAERDDDPYPYCEALYKTRYGAYFIVKYNEEYYNPHNEEIDLRDAIEPLPKEKAMAWLEKYNNKKIYDYFDVEEAGDEDTTLTLRMSKSLKKRLSEAAIDADQSLNAWCVKTLQRVLEASRQQTAKQDE
ncbi:hypothetical protein AA309_22780 [Microvirga vignae]|uniref:Uncharacterized protein n=1 Tax=Microvirga vignae TaxID=1225564 RepID=A0A0H1R7H9_9HYPH|nr:toxin-antitoxin system HicB family antitoxin [Microvirga vignae]KLK91004.1 hypothetical protein AA309_22780 [Microvirga vignae]